MRQGAGARASGMGSAFVALADDATAGYWNPAGLSQMGLNIYQAAIQYAYLPNEMSTSFISYAFLWPEVGEFSLAWLNFSIGQIDVFDQDQNLLNQTSSSENAFILSYGRKMYHWVKGLSLGTSIKVLQQSVADYSAAGYGLDVGVLWQPVLYFDHTIGINVQNLFQQLNWTGSTADPSDINVKAGIALKFYQSDDVLYFNHLIQTIDLDMTSSNRLGWSTGLEYWTTGSLGLRAGYNHLAQEVTMGASYKPAYYALDYAFHYNFTENVSHQHRVTLQLRFGAAKNHFK